MSIIPFQSKFDKDFPIVIGNAEYNAECELLKAMDLVIATSGMEETFIKYALDVGYVNKLYLFSELARVLALRQKKLKLFGKMPYLHCGYLFFVSILGSRYDDLYWLFLIAICTNSFAGSTDFPRPKSLAKAPSMIMRT